MKKTKTPNLNLEIVTFGLVSIVWLVLGEVLCQLLNSTSEKVWFASKWLFGIWILCIVDLYVLRMLVWSVLQILGSNQEKGVLYVIQTAFWGALKLVCLGLFIIVLLKGQKIPLHSLLLGIGTLGMVPLAGGFLWSQRLLPEGIKDA